MPHDPNPGPAMRDKAICAFRSMLDGVDASEIPRRGFKFVFDAGNVRARITIWVPLSQPDPDDPESGKQSPRRELAEPMPRLSKWERTIINRAMPGTPYTPRALANCARHGLDPYFYGLLGKLKDKGLLIDEEGEWSLTERGKAVRLELRK